MNVTEYRARLAKAKPKRSKYGNIKVEEDGFVFDSKAEYKHYCHLKVLAAAGALNRLIVHPGYDLGSCYYKADFAYQCVGADHPRYTKVVDVKGKLTPDCRIKLKLMKERYGIDVKLVTKETNPEVFR